MTLTSAAPLDEAAFLAIAKRNPVNAALLARLDALGTPDTWLVAGCLFQTVWNLASGRPPEEGIADYDIFYCDPADLSWNAEDAVIARAKRLFGDLGATVEVRNQARVHLWYETKFGVPPPAPLRSSREGIAGFLVAGSCVGIGNGASGPAVYAPYGLDDIAEGILRPNPQNDRPTLFAAKAASYQRRWPWLRIIPQAPKRPNSSRDTVTDASPSIP